MAKYLAKLAELARGLPKGLSADWNGSNHYEMHQNGRDYFWLMVEGEFNCDTEDGKRMGLMMDIAAEVARLRDAGKL